jgi:hypothetical protein
VATTRNNKVVEYLLLPSNKCDPEVTDRWGISPLFDAIKHGNGVAARILYETGARLSTGKVGQSWLAKSVLG